ncbi:MAG TPA: NAD(P)H-dependent oxidoreductase [Myxococcota bacterium]|nr:NAD(P)H-dependent oxidoreductase [Myxococcota bacterium]
MKLLAISGSLRKGSFNKQLLARATVLLEKAGAEVESVDLRALALPFYDGDLEAGSGVPQAAQDLARLVHGAAGLVIASPEYNFGVPAIVKNAIDWLSRVKPMPLRGKTALLLSASMGLVGGNRGLWSLRVPLEVLGVHVQPDMFSLASAHQAFAEDGGLRDELLEKLLGRMVDSYLRVTEALSSAGKKS